MRWFPCTAATLLTLSLPAFVFAADAPPMPLLTIKSGSEKSLSPSSAQVSARFTSISASPDIEVSIQPGSDAYPGVALKPEKPWDLSRYGHVEARIVNTGAAPLFIGLRIDNAGDWRDNPWNSESLTLQPGASGTIKVLFGRSYGFKPGFKLKTEAITNLLLFTTKTDTPRSFRIESILAAGAAGETPEQSPEAIRIQPKDGYLLDSAPLNDTSLPGMTVEGHGIRTKFQPPANKMTLSFQPKQGRWDLREYSEVTVQVRNDSSTAITPRAQLASNGGPTEWIAATQPIAPGKETTLTLPFFPSTVPAVEKPASLPKFTSDAVSAIKLEVETPAGEAVTGPVSLLANVRAISPPATLPDWLGKRPPVPGDWKMTLDDEFNGKTLDTSIWDPEGENYYDKVSHWSKDDVLVGEGVVRLRYEKKTGYQNDDPKRNKTDYAAGFLNGYKRWAQRYGYFEARMKLPSAPGLWPAFWMMPDRGPGAKDRQTTAEGGMEFDIMENLTRWKTTRYNIAMHYDGYGSAHKASGSDRIYVQPDRDGFLTCGLLWTPGLAVYYCNGREVLRWENPRISNVPSTIMFTLPSGGWDNDALDDAKLPADFVIDYVRVWQRKDLASSADNIPRAAGR